ncbi:MAG: hypothetical protein RIR66_21, partial [Actinomycetota bacterium]
SEKLLSNVLATSGETFTPISPFPNEYIPPVQISSIDDVKVAASNAREAAKQWAKVKVKDRVKIFDRYFDLLMGNQDLLNDVVQIETGKARAHASAEILGVAMISSLYSKISQKTLKPQRRKGVFPLLTKTEVIHQPKGVVGIISPWNYPLTLSIYDAIPALIAGNAVVLRPDLQTSWSALHAVKLLEDAGLPHGLITVVLGDGPNIGTALIDEVDYICFTGSTATGRKVGAKAGERLIGSSLELGGKNPMIVCQDADMNTFLESAIQGCFSSAGQLCVSIERMFIHESIYEKFLAAFVDRVNHLKLGANVGWGYDMGSLGTAAIADRVSTAVNEAVREGATIQTGGKLRQDIGPHVFEPTILTGITNDMKIYRDEVFGPVVYVMPFRTEQEAIELANDSEYGLSASVISRDLKRAGKIAAQIRSGSVNVNDGFAAAFGSVAAPMGGMGQSGLGRRHGAEGLIRFTEPQNISMHGRYLMGPKFGISEEKWNGLVANSLRLLKKLRIR